jgi:LEA14-like dessication related protein
MRRVPKIAIIVCIIVSIGVFGYMEYLSAIHLSISILESKIVQKNDKNTSYNMKIQFKNPSLLPINVGKTDFVISINDENLGSGRLQPLVIAPIGKTVSLAPFLADNIILHKYNQTDNIPKIKLIGISKYEIMTLSLDVPFTYYPTQTEAREFIHGN